MNQGRIWCVVNPSIGLPLLLGSVALTSLAVHTAVMTHVTWMDNYWSGASRKVADNGGPTATAAKTEAGFSMSVTPVAAVDASSPASFVITVTPAPAAAAAPDVKPYHAASAD